MGGMNDVGEGDQGEAGKKSWRELMLVPGIPSKGKCSSGPRRRCRSEANL
jgi:hypothetical protein